MYYEWVPDYEERCSCMKKCTLSTLILNLPLQLPWNWIINLWKPTLNGEKPKTILMVFKRPMQRPSLNSIFHWVEFSLCHYRARWPPYSSLFILSFVIKKLRIIRIIILRIQVTSLSYHEFLDKQEFLKLTHAITYLAKRNEATNNVQYR